MKYLIPVFCSLLVSFLSATASAQTYTVKYKCELSFQQPTGVFATSVPKQYAQGILLYSNGESNYRESESSTTPSGSKDANAQVVTTGGDLVYKKMSDKLILEDYDIVGKKKVVRQEPLAWTHHKETQKISNYTCKLAECTSRNMRFKVWYTPEIPIPDGPRNYAGLPGLVLKVEWEYGTIVASTIQTTAGVAKIERLSAENAISEKEADRLLRDRIEEFARSTNGKMETVKP